MEPGAELCVLPRATKQHKLMFERVLDESPAERAKHYRTLARTAEANAAATNLPQARAAHLRSAHRWNTLAALMELGKDYTPRRIARVASARSRTRAPATAMPKTMG
jgi:hypothetical protein